MKRIVLAALAGGIVFFIWSSIIHMSPLGMIGIRSLPEPAYQAIKTNMGEAGLYFFPGMEEKPTPEQKKAWEQRLKTGPYGLLVFSPGYGGMGAQQLIGELLTDIVAAFIAATILALIAAAYLRRAMVVTLIGAFGWVSLLLSYWLWYNFPTKYILNEGFIEIVGWFLAGLVIAKIVPPRAAVPA